MPSPMPPETPVNLVVGTRLGHYEILGLIGVGGRGQVYRASETKLQRDVALKLLPADTAADPERRQRFEREARAVAALNHPNIVTIHSVDEADGQVFLTMELVEGQMVSELIRPGGLPLAQLLDIAVPLADAVSAAHARGITHRDLKPANVMVTPGRQVKVLDFGLAKPFDAGGVSDAMATEAPEVITGQGRILGTVACMAPEQAEGKAVDAHRRAVVSGGRSEGRRADLAPRQSQAPVPGRRPTHADRLGDEGLEAAVRIPTRGRRFADAVARRARDLRAHQQPAGRHRARQADGRREVARGLEPTRRRRDGRRPVERHRHHYGATLVPCRASH